MWLLGKSKALPLLCVALGCLSAHAQEKVESSFYFGLGGGYHSSHMSVSRLDKSVFPDNRTQGSGEFDLFLQYEFGRKKQFGVRLEADFLKRGGTLGRLYDTKDYGNLYEEAGIGDIFYDLRSSYVDLRLPLIYQFCGARSVLRPYVYVAPMVAFSTGGTIKMQIDSRAGEYEGVRLPITKGNMRSAYFGGAVGAGLKYDLNLYGHPFYISVEANYQMGFTDTYSAKEKDGEAVVRNGLMNPVYDIKGTRRFNGWEIKGSVSIPLSIFCKKKEVVEIIPEPVCEAPIVVAQPVEIVEEVEEVVEEAPCRSIREVSEMIERGENIHGVTFCSIDDIRFETGKSNLVGSSHAYLDRLASILKKTGEHIEVMGHTDNTGTKDFNLRLSKERALAVVNYLKRLGVPSGQLSYSYYGDSRPIRDNSTETGRSINRRVEFEIK